MAENNGKATELFLFRHGETEWSKSGQHTGRTDIPLTDTGREQARALRSFVDSLSFQLVLVSPLQRAVETAKLAGLASQIEVCQDLAEVDYGDYEGITTAEIRKSIPGWTIWTHPCPNGETLAEAGARAQRVIQRVEKVCGNVALISHGHMLRILTATYLNVGPENGRHFMLDTSTMCLLGHEHDEPAIRVWNAPAQLSAVVI